MNRRNTLLGISLIAGLAGFFLPVGLLAFLPTPTVEAQREPQPLSQQPPSPLKENAAAAVAPQTTAIHLEVSLRQRQVDLYRGDHKLKSYPIAIGQQGWETPIGTFQVRQKFIDPQWIHPLTDQTIAAGDPQNPLGGYWVGFWSDGRNWVGFHGTPDAETVGSDASHGCLRMYDQDIAELFQLVNLGTVVRVKP